MNATRIVAIRHGETTWNAEKRIQGQLDTPLSELGRWQAEQAGLALAQEQFDAIYASDLQRAFHTAQAIAQHHGLPVIGHEGLRERHFGSFQGLTWSEIQERWPDASLSWQQRDRWFNPGEGESLVVFGQRVVSAVHAIAGAHPGQHILLAAHGGVMDVLYRHANGLAIEAPRNWELGNAAINRLLWTPQSLTLVHWGDTSHLDGQAVLDESST
jgi:2,3-bisphosphoglycerate-dependent phosphoglycerate mutase